MNGAGVGPAGLDWVRSWRVDRREFERLWEGR